MAALVAIGSDPARAQTALDDQVRASYPPPEYKPIGVDLGMGDSLLLFPKAEVRVTHTDNLFREGSGRIADQIVTFAPSLDLRSDWDNHAFEAGVRVVYARHVENPDENYIDVVGRLRGKIDITEDDLIDLEASHGRLHEERGSIDDVDEQEPTIFYLTTGKLIAQHQGGAVLLRATGKVDRLDFTDNGPVDNDDRDRVESELRLRAGYEIVEAVQPFVEVAVNDRTFDRATDTDGIRRGSDGWEVLAGNTFDVSAVTFAEAAVGYRRQTFDEAAFEPVSGLTFNGRAVWNPTDLMTFTLRVERQIQETTSVTSSAITSTDATIGLDYVPLDNLLATTRLGYGEDDFEGQGGTDKRWRFEFGLEYLVGSNYVLGASYVQSRRVSSDDADDFIANDVIVRFGSQL
jgi:hypothetical protein